MTIAGLGEALRGDCPRDAPVLILTPDGLRAIEVVTATWVNETTLKASTSGQYAVVLNPWSAGR
jgi:hypothetical protein